MDLNDIVFVRKSDVLYITLEDEYDAKTETFTGPNHRRVLFREVLGMMLLFSLNHFTDTGERVLHIKDPQGEPMLTLTFLLI